MTIPPTIARWHRIALENLPEELAGILAEDSVFESPVVHTPQVGRAIVEMYLRGALKVLNTEHFRYGDEWYALRDASAPQGEGSAVLEFFSQIEGIRINGVDLIYWNEAGTLRP